MGLPGRTGLAGAVDDFELISLEYLGVLRVGEGVRRGGLGGVARDGLVELHGQLAELLAGDGPEKSTVTLSVTSPSWMALLILGYGPVGHPVLARRHRSAHRLVGQCRAADGECGLGEQAGSQIGEISGILCIKPYLVDTRILGAPTFQVLVASISRTFS